MGKIDRRMLLQSTKGVTVNLDRGGVMENTLPYAPDITMPSAALASKRATTEGYLFIALQDVRCQTYLNL
ncbi:hypothetical protein ACFLVS_06815 [Chloroflexota bacterium]